MRTMACLNPNPVSLWVVFLHPSSTARTNPWVQVTPQQQHGHLVIKLVQQLVYTRSAACHTRVPTNHSVKDLSGVGILCSPDDGLHQVIVNIGLVNIDLQRELKLSNAAALHTGNWTSLQTEHM